MTLRRKTLLAVALTLLALLAMLYALTSSVLLSGFARVEEQGTRQVVKGVLNVQSQTVAQFNERFADWSAWDDLYAFVQDGNAAFVKSNLTAGSLQTLNIQFIALVRRDGKIIFATGYDPGLRRKRPIPPELRNCLARGNSLLDHRDINSSRAGILLVAGRPMMLCARPIVTSERQGPIRGTLLVGRTLDVAQVEQLSRVTPLRLSMPPISAPRPIDVPPLEAFAVASSAAPQILVRPLDASMVAGYALLSDIYGRPALLLRVLTARTFHEQGQRTLRYLLGAVLVAGGAFSIVTLLLVEKMVLRRLSGLSRDVDEISRGGDISARVSARGRDELASLSKGINQMLGALQESQARLSESEELYREMTQMALSASDTFFVARPGSSELQWLGDIDAMLGLERNAFPRTLAAWQEAIHSADRERVWAAYQAALRGEPFEIEYRVCSRDGATRYWANRGKALRDARGGLEKFIAACTDITMRKEAEERLHAYASELQRSNRELQEFTFVSSHDLQEPLRKILAFGERLQNKCAPQLGQEGCKYLERVLSSATRMSALIEDLLSFSRVTTKAQALNFVDLNAVSREVLGDLEADLGSSGGRVEVGLLPTIQADAAQMRQLLQHLLDNALKFHRPGVPPQVQVSARTLDLEGGALCEMCELKVSDNGIGFGPEHSESIFAPLKRLHDRAEFEGTGIGLAICRKIAERHGGSIEARAELGAGATFTVRLPVSAVSPASAGADAQKAKILLESGDLAMKHRDASRMTL